MFVTVWNINVTDEHKLATWYVLEMNAVYSNTF